MTYKLFRQSSGKLGLLACLAVCGIPAARGGEWPQILGPTRNGIAQREHLAAAWPAGGPRTLWQHEVGTGYAGVAVAQGKAVVFHRRGDQEIVEGLDAITGKPLWKREFPTNYVSTIAPDDGPLCVPLIHDQNVYLYDAQGNLHALRMTDGSVRWSRALGKEFKAPDGYFGAGSTPLVEKDKILVNVGGKGAGIVSCALEDGSIAWRATDELASYSAPIVTTIGGERCALFVTRLNFVALDPANGKVRFQFPFGQRGPTVNAATPLLLDDHVFLSASYGIGAAWARLSKDKADVEWTSDEVMSSQYTTCVAHEGYLYGIDGRQDGPPGSLRCIDPAKKRVVWNEGGFGTGNLILADNKLLILKTDGELLLAEPSPERFKKLAAAKVLEETAQPLPALAAGRLYVRDTKVLKCLDVGAADTR